MKDIHAMPPAIPRLALGKVGITGVRKPLVIHRPDRTQTLAASLEVYVDIPESRKGSDLSRNAQILAEAVDSTVIRPSPSLEATCVRIAAELLKRHEYAREAEVRAEAEYFRQRGISGDRLSLEDYRLFGQAWASRGNGTPRLRKAIGAEGVGMTACPCAMETCRNALAEEFPELREARFDALPMITHNQRNRSRLTLVLPEEVEVEADRLLDVIEEAQSSPTYAILKRGDEGTLVLNAHRKPRFVEDVIRSLLTLAAERFPELPDGVEVFAETQSEESIHKYDVRAEHRASLGELRAGARKGTA
ncbi:MAG: GTP cyclohydrolase I FolE2 [Euryarchaeota archaeon]|nr:GTP cyclohydrolase I FolE2 [Euryarchaeota archaeon]MDE1880909.1 GTP cyclohydrolase I FolE2 [Euryarchaeota archaeon]MDE2044323.1 GTP cyclohydrolase I FolE2 [Thermoplasmata archaeon]